MIWVGALLLVALPLGFALCQYWANSRPPGAVRLESERSEPKPELESALEPENTPRP